MYRFFFFIFCVTSTLRSSHHFPIYEAQNIEEAQLLIDNGVLNHLPLQDKQILLEKLARPSYVPGLITLYKKHGLNITQCDAAGWTFLMNLALWPQKYLLQKAELMLEDLTHTQITQLIAIKDCNKDTVFTLIEKRKEDFYISSPHHVENLNAYRTFLIKKIHAAIASNLER